MVAREMQELTCLPLLPSRSAQPGRQLSTGPRVFASERKKWIAALRLHTGKGAPHVALFPIRDGECQMYGELVSSSSLSTLKIRGLDSKPEINYHSICKTKPEAVLLVLGILEYQVLMKRPWGKEEPGTSASQRCGRSLLSSPPRAWEAISTRWDVASWAQGDYLQPAPGKRLLQAAPSVQPQAITAFCHHYFSPAPKTFYWVSLLSFQSQLYLYWQAKGFVYSSHRFTECLLSADPWV